MPDYNRAPFLGQYTNTIVVGGGIGTYSTIQAAIDSVAMPVLGYTYYAVDFTDNVHDGDWFQLNVQGHATNPDSNHVYEFDTNAVITQTCPTCAAPAHSIDVSGDQSPAAAATAAGAAVEAVQNGFGDNSLGYTILSEGIAVFINPSAGWKYFAFTSGLTHALQSTTLAPEYYRETPNEETAIRLMPGIYDEVVRLNKGIHIIGESRDRCIIRKLATVGSVVYMQSHTSLQNVSVLNTYEDGTSARYSGIWVGVLYEDITDVLIDNCYVEARHYPIYSSECLGAKSYLTVKDCTLRGANCIYLEESYHHCYFIDNTMYWTGRGGVCLSFVDGLVGPYKCVWKGNAAYLERTSSAVSGYCMRINGWGNLIADNTVRVVSQASTNAVTFFLQIGAADTLPSDEPNMLPNIVTGNTFLIDDYGTAPATITALILGGDAVEVVADLILGNNNFFSNIAPATKVSIQAKQTTASPHATITLLPGAFGGWEDGTVSLTNVDLAFKTPVQNLLFGPMTVNASGVARLFGADLTGADTSGYEFGRYVRVSEANLAGAPSAATASKTLTATLYQGGGAQALTCVLTANSPDNTNYRRTVDAAHPIDFAATNDLGLKIIATDTIDWTNVSVGLKAQGLT